MSICKHAIVFSCRHYWGLLFKKWYILTAYLRFSKYAYYFKIHYVLQLYAKVLQWDYYLYKNMLADCKLHILDLFELNLDLFESILLWVSSQWKAAMIYFVKTGSAGSVPTTFRVLVERSPSWATITHCWSTSYSHVVFTNMSLIHYKRMLHLI